MINQNFVIVGFIFQIIGGLNYLIDTLKGRVQPNRVTWFLWAAAPLIAFSAEIKQGVGIQSLTTFGAGAIPVLVFLASFFNKKAVWKLGALDYVCGILSLLGLVIWYVTKVGNVAILFSIISDGLASTPTIIKTIRRPQSESSGIYLAGLISTVLSVLTITTWNFATWAFPVYLVFINLLLFVLVKFPQKKHL